MISTGNCFLKPYKIYQTHQTHPTVYISHHFTSFHILNSIYFGLLKSPQSTVCPSLQGREAPGVPGLQLGPRRQQHPARLRAVFGRRLVQRGAAAAVRRGHGAGHRPQQVPHPAEAVEHGRVEDVVVASGATGRPGRHRWKGRRGHTERRSKKIFTRIKLELK